MRRIVLAVAAVSALSIPTAVGVAGLATPAGAAGSLSCSALKGKTTSAITISKCVVPKADKAAYKKLVAPSAAALAVGGPLTWTGGAVTTFGTPTLSAGSGCPAGDTAEQATGTVTADTSVFGLTGSTYSGTVCVAPAKKPGAPQKIFNAPGSTFTL